MWQGSGPVESEKKSKQKDALIRAVLLFFGEK